MIKQTKKSVTETLNEIGFFAHIAVPNFSVFGHLGRLLVSSELFIYLVSFLYTVGQLQSNLV